MTASPDYLNAVFVRLSQVFGWPAKALEQREVRARLAELSERELRDIGGARPEPTTKLDETPEECRARALAVRAWHHGIAKAA